MRKAIIASNQRMAAWAAHQLGLAPNEFVFISTESADGEMKLHGVRLTMDDVIFAPGYRHGRMIEAVENELALRCEGFTDMPFRSPIFDFDDTRP